MRFLIIGLFVFFTLNINATNVKTDSIDFDSLTVSSKQFIPNTFFKNRYQHNTFEQYIDNYQEFIIYQTETTGDFSQANLQTFSILGNSHKWNKFYMDDFRIDDIHCINSIYMKQISELIYGIQALNLHRFQIRKIQFWQDIIVVVWAELLRFHKI